MKKEQSHISRYAGFSLVEVILSTAIFGLLVTTLVGGFLYGQEATFLAGSRARATMLAEEGIEAVRNIRDADFANLADSVGTGLSTGANQWSFSGSTDTVDIFTRHLTISPIDAHRKSVTSTITWQQNPQRTGLITLNSYFTNWRRTKAGFTLIKTVINHGGTKVIADFAPYSLTTTVFSGEPPTANQVVTTITPGQSVDLEMGTYTVSEVLDANYTQTFSGDCNASGVFVVSDGTAKSCTITNEEKVSVAVLSTSTTSAINTTTATSGGDISTDGGSPITSRGVVWDTAPSPTIALSTKTLDGSGIGIYSSSITGLTANTLYYVRAYATNALGTVYGNEVTFTTDPSIVSPTVSTSSTVTSIQKTTATSGGNVLLDGGSPITARGVVWNTAPNPTIILNTITFDGTSTGSFFSSITNLTCDTLYYVRAYATNVAGTSYGSDITFTTSACDTTPTLTTSAISAITKTTASSGGNITSDGGASVTARGVVWDTSTNPTIALPTKTSDGTGTGSFVSNITGLTCNTTYYVKAYATNSVGTAYGNELSFKTASCVTHIASASAGAVTVTIPAHQVGDLLVIFAYRDGNNTSPSLPAGWTNIGTANGGTNNSSRLAYRIATVTNTSSGTWGNATGLVVHVYRGQNTVTPIGGDGNVGGNNTTVIYPTLTMTQTDGTSWVAGFAGHRSINTALETSPTGMTNRTINVNATNEVVGHDTNSGVSSWANTNVNVGGTSSGWRARTLEIISQ